MDHRGIAIPEAVPSVDGQGSDQENFGSFLGKSMLGVQRWRPMRMAMVIFSGRLEKLISSTCGKRMVKSSRADANRGSEETTQAPYRLHQSDILCGQRRCEGGSSVRVTRSPASKTMLHECMIQDSTFNNLSWYTRIPSPSNIADAPSRMRLDEVAELFQFELVKPVLDYMNWGRIG